MLTYRGLLDTYSHVVEGMEERAAERLEAVIMGLETRTAGGLP